MSTEAETIEVRTERDNDQITRVLRLDPLERLYRKEVISADEFRVGRSLQNDLRAIESTGGGGGLARLGEEFVALARSTSPSKAIDRPLEAAQRVAKARERVGADWAFLVLCELLQGYTPSDLDKRWFKARTKGTARDTVVMALERVTDSAVYETQKHRVQIWAEAAA